MKFGGTSVADAERLKRAAQRIVAKREAGHRVVAVLSARGKETDRLIADAHEVSPHPDPREMDMLLLDRRARVLRAVRHGHQRPRPPRHLADRVAGRDRDRHLAHQGAHPRRARRSHLRRARRGLDRPRRRLSGREHGPRRDDARPRRLGHHRRRPGRRRRRRGVRDLHRRPRRLLGRSADRAQRAQAAGPVLRGDARDGGLGRRGAAAALGRVRAQPRRAHPLPIELRRRARYRCRIRRGNHGAAPHHRRHPLARRGPRHAHGRAGHARHRGARDHRAGRGEREHRHDHPGRARDRGPARGHVVHHPARRHPRGARLRWTRSPPSWG